ncbi:MAG: phosphoenolpyruvate--protein phosphotransferase [bacterium]|nr:phosphoenolpyruvate--protein phosphotransferase [bacterium]
MKILKGTPIFPSIVKGKIYLYLDESEIDIPHYDIEAKDVDLELTRFSLALDSVKAEITQMISKTKTADKNIREICTVHLMILDDKDLSSKITNFIKIKQENAEHAVSDIFQEYIDKYKQKESHFQELTYDFIDLRTRVLNRLMTTGDTFNCPISKDQQTIVAAKKLTPYMVLNSKKNHVAAYIIEEGGFTTHAIIIARSMGLPVIFNVKVDESISCLDDVIIDSFEGDIIINPNEKTLLEYVEKTKNIEKKHQFCKLGLKRPPLSQTGETINLKVNISLPEEIHLLENLLYDGIGLLRTEFLFLNRNHPPTEDAQFTMYKNFLEAAKGKEVTIRLLDIGSDKTPLFFTLPSQINPDLEIKGARAIEVFPKVYLDQAKALLRAAKFGQLKILYPMVSDISDILTFKKLFNQAKTELKKTGQKFSTNYKEGIMIETPAAALLAEEMLEHVNFANIGSNDLQQYTLAASRENKIVDKRYHLFHPALVKLIEMIMIAGRKTNKEICLCGEIGAFEYFYPTLLSLGLTNFSIPVSKLFFIRCEIMHLHHKKLDLDKMYKATSKKDLEMLFQDSFKQV